MAEFEYFNLNDVDPTFHPIDPGVYALRLKKIEFKTIIPSKGQRVGLETPLVNANFSVINHDKFSGRSLRYTFWPANSYDQKALARLSTAVGVPQEQGEPFPEYIKRLGETNPPVEFKTFVAIEQSGVDETVDPPKPIMDNKIKWSNVLPIN